MRQQLHNRQVRVISSRPVPLRTWARTLPRQLVSFNILSVSQSILFQEVYQESRKRCCSFLNTHQKISNYMLLNWRKAFTGIIIRNQFDQKPRNGVQYSQRNWVIVAGHFPNIYAIYDQNLRFSLSYLWRDQTFDIQFMTNRVGTDALNVIYKELFVMILPIAIWKVAFLQKKHRLS